MSKLKTFFQSLTDNNVEVSVKANGVSASINGEGIGGHVTAEALDNAYESIKTRAAKKGISVADTATLQIEEKIDEEMEEEETYSFN